MSTSPQQNACASTPSSSRQTGPHRGSSSHVPTTPSRLRKSVIVDSERSSIGHDIDKLTPLSSPLLGTLTISAEPEQMTSPPSSPAIRDELAERSRRQADARICLLDGYNNSSVCGARHCNHGTFSPHVFPQDSPPSTVNSVKGFGGRYGGDVDDDFGMVVNRTRGWLRDTFADGLFGGLGRNRSMSTTRWLATKHGIKNQFTM